MNDLTHTLKRLRRGLLAQSFLDKTAACALVAGAFVIVIFSVRLLPGHDFAQTDLFGKMSALTLMAAALWTFARRVTLIETARRIDQLGQTRDRFATGLAFTGLATRTEFQQSALDECQRYIASLDARRFTRLRLPREVRWLAVPVIAAALLAWQAQLARDAARPNPRDAREIAQTAAALEQLAKQLELPKPNADDALKKIAGEMRKSAARLRDQAERPVDGRKAALSELSALQAQLEKMKSAAAPELAALAEALRQVNASRAAAEDLQRGDAEAAAAELDKAREAAQEIAQAMKDAKRPEENSGAVAKSMSQLALAAGSKEDAQKALQRLAEAVRRSGQSSSTQSQSSPGGKALQQALHALQDMKQGRSTASLANASESSQNGAAQVAVRDFTKSETGVAAVNTSQPSGQPGSEHDLGTTRTPFGERQQKVGAQRDPVSLSGSLGKGESLQTLISTHGDSSQSAQRYRALYDAMSPAAEDAVMQENIPLGSRYFVKRYFDSIRPKE